MLTWARIGPRKDERVLAGRVAGALWLTVLPMISVAFLLPGTVTEHWLLLWLLTVPTAVWGVACFFLIDWNRVPTPLYFHVPSVLALAYIALLVAWTGVVFSPFSPTLLMLLAFCAYFYPPRVAIAYIAGCLVIRALPAVYDDYALHAGAIAQTWVSGLVFASVGAVIMIGKRELLALRDVAHQLSLRDSLTGLANRRAFNELVDNQQVGRTRESFGLVLLDLDNFKEANTLHGLPGGDQVLCAVADALLDVTRSEDLVIRLGGDEFAVVTFGMTRHGMKRLVDRALERVRDAGAALELSGFHLSASAGWAITPEDADTFDELMTAADLALRAAKMSGKNTAQAPVDWIPERLP